MMALLNDTAPIRAARDDFERYYTEKIWDWIPGIYKHEDGLAENAGVLRAMVEVMARQAAVARRSVDRLWEDVFIDFCDDWAVPYLADLVGTRLVHELNRRGRRVDVARTLFYRRRKGTPRVLEALIRDIAGWEGVVVESFRRLGRARHGLDALPATLAGPVTGTPPGGTADLRNGRVSELVDGPFDETAHTADFRRLQGFQGRYNIPKLNFHLYRLLPFRVVLGTPRSFGEERFTFDPSGRDAPLFGPDQRPELDGEGAWEPAREWQIPAPIPCRLLGAATYRLEAADLPAGLEDELAPFVGELFKNEARLRQTLATVLDPLVLADHLGEILAGAITLGSPKLHLLPAAVSVTVGEDSGEDAVPRQEIASANLGRWIFPDDRHQLAIDPVRGRFQLREAPEGDDRVFVPLYHYGFSGPIGAGTYERRGSVDAEIDGEIDGGPQTAGGHELDPGPIDGFALPTEGVHEFVNSKTYRPANGDLVLTGDLCLQARDGERPYLEIELAGGDDVWTIEGGSEDEPRELVLEGLWIGITPGDLEAQAVGEDEACDPVPVTLALEGNFTRVVIRHVTLDPGGEQARLDPLECIPIPSVALRVRGQVDELVVDSSIVGAIREATDQGDPCSVNRLVVSDSIVHNLVPGESAIETRVAEVHLERVTVVGDVVADRLYASEALIQGTVRVTDDQRGCFRFSAADDRPANRLPPQFESHLFAPAIPNHFFVSRRFGDPGYVQLSETAPRELVRGAENGSEIGAWSALLNPIKLDDLAAKVEELMPFGLIAQYVFET